MADLRPTICNTIINQQQTNSWIRENWPIVIKYTLLLFKERYNLPLIVKVNVNEALEMDFPILYKAFQKKASKHVCNVKGCTSCLVVDGHMKAHRKICSEKGCVNDPK